MYAQQIIEGLKISDAAKDALRLCISKRGKYAGYLSRTKPKWGTPAYAAHAAAMLVANPLKAGVGTSMMAHMGVHGDIYREVFAALDALPVRVSGLLDLDRVQLERMGVY